MMRAATRVRMTRVPRKPATPRPESGPRYQTRLLAGVSAGILVRLADGWHLVTAELGATRLTRAAPAAPRLGALGDLLTRTGAELVLEEATPERGAVTVSEVEASRAEPADPGQRSPTRTTRSRRPVPPPESPDETVGRARRAPTRRGSGKPL